MSKLFNGENLNNLNQILSGDMFKIRPNSVPEIKMVLKGEIITIVHTK